MATIRDLNTSILDMPDDEAFALIRYIRHRRLIMPDRTRQYLATKREKAVKKEKAIVNVLQAMSQEDRLKLINMLEES